MFQFLRCGQGHHPADGITHQLYGAAHVLKDQFHHLVGPTVDAVEPALAIQLSFQPRRRFGAVAETHQIHGYNTMLILERWHGVPPVLLAGPEAMNQHHCAGRWCGVGG